MYIQQLESFIKVAEYGSFSKAANAMYITPSAVIQQINNLERSLRIVLFSRTKRGVTLTPAGEFLLSECRDLIQKTHAIDSGLERFRTQEQRVLCVGTTFLHKCRIFHPVWKAFRGNHPEYTVRMQPLDSRLPDLVESIRDGQSWQRYMDFLPLYSSPLICAVPDDHPLSDCQLLTLEDMRTATLVTITRALSPQQKELIRIMQSAGVHVVEVRSYDVSVFGYCRSNGYLLQIPEVWKDLDQGMKPIPCQWDFAVDYGFFYRRDADAHVGEFIRFAETWLNAHPDILHPITAGTP
ncbi:MAG: LysR family transcriptional regulator [Clostridia bacterium]|nr:LysR family transcriptional regulator [Clostridia bacterium]